MFFPRPLNSELTGAKWCKTWRHWLSLCRVACSVPSHYLHQIWIIGTCTIRNKFQWNRNQNTHIFIQENELRDVIRKMAPCVTDPLKRESAIDRRTFCSTYDLFTCVILWLMLVNDKIGEHFHYVIVLVIVMGYQCSILYIEWTRSNCMYNLMYLFCNKDILFILYSTF